MKGINTFIERASKSTGVDVKDCDIIIQSTTKAINNGALGGTNYMTQLSKLRKKKFTSINEIADIVSADTNHDREECKKVVGWLVDMMVETMNRGGMPALIRMVNLMKKGQEESINKKVDYNDELKDINDMLKKSNSEEAK